MHTVESDGSGTADDVKTAALHNGVDAVIVTNHTKMLTLDEWNALDKRARELSSDDFLMINAFEVTGSEGLFLRDHVLAWNVADPFVGRDTDELAPEEVWPSPANPNGTGPMYPENIRKWVRYIHRHGGIAVHAHTQGSTSPSYGVDFIEIFNLSHVKDVAGYATMMGFPAQEAWGLGLTLNNMAIYGDRDLSMPVTIPNLPTMPLRDALYVATQQMTTVGQVLGEPGTPIHSWDELLLAYVDGELDHPTFGVADSDAHNTANLSANVDYSDVGQARNGVFVRRLTQHSLFGAIEAGRCFATTGPSMAFTVNGEMMGETVVLKSWKRRAVKLDLSVNAESATAVVAKVTIVRNGKPWKVLSPMAPSYRTALCDTVDQDGYYRVEVVSVDAVTGEYQFAYSNPVFVDVHRHGCGR
jgi:hypothetical protein